MSMDDVRKNLGGALSIFAKALEASVNTMTEKPEAPQLEYVDELMSYFPLTKVDERAGTIDQYLFDLRKTVIDNYDNGNYQVSYFYAHLILMSYVYYSVDLAYKYLPDKLKDQYDLINSYNAKDKPNIATNTDVYLFSKIPEKEIFKVFYAIGMDVQYIQQLSSYVSSRDQYAHATGKGNIDVKTFETYIDTIKKNMGTIHQLFHQYIKERYTDFLIANCKLTYKDVITKIGDYISDENFSTKDIEYLSNLGISNIRNENEEFKRNYRFARRVHCAFVEYCIDNYGIVPPANYESLRNEAFLYYKYVNRAEEYVENELGISAYACAKDGGRFPVFECVNCDEEQLAYDEEHNKYHCFACGENYAGDALTFCTGCGSIMIPNEVDLCGNCIARKMEE